MHFVFFTDIKIYYNQRRSHTACCHRANGRMSISQREMRKCAFTIVFYNTFVFWVCQENLFVILTIYFMNDNITSIKCKRSGDKMKFEDLKKITVDEIKNDIEMYACGEKSSILGIVYDNNLMLYDKLLVQYHWYDKAFDDVAKNTYRPLIDAEEKQIEKYANYIAEEVKFLIDRHFQNWEKKGRESINITIDDVKKPKAKLVSNSRTQVSHGTTLMR